MVHYESHTYEVDPTTGTVGSYLTSETWYDERGQVEQITDSLDQATTYEYDGLGRLTKVTQPDPDGAGAELELWTVYVYDDAGNLTSVTDRLSHSTSYTYDPIGRETSKTDANNDTTEYAYDNAGYLASLTDPEENTTSWVYDDMGRTTEETNELNDTHYYAYNAAGYLWQETDRNERVTEYTYDFQGNMTGELWKDGQTTIHEFTFGYDQLGWLTSASDSNATYEYKYDAADRLYEETQDLDGLTPMVVLNYEYNDIGLPSQTAITIGGTGDVVTDYLYDVFAQIESIQQHGAIGGNAVAEKRVDYTNDDAGQLTGADYDEYQDDESYVYDDNGNRITANGDTYATDDNNQLTSDDTYAYTYDDEGNRTLKRVYAPFHVGEGDFPGILNSRKRFSFLCRK